MIFQHALRIVSRSELGDEAEREILRALEAARPGNLAFSYLATAGLELPRELVLNRCAANFFGYACINLTDDLSDGDCTYLPEPARTGPTVQYLLQNLFAATMVKASIPADTIAHVAADLLAAGAAQLAETRTTEWNYARSRALAEGGAGRQWAAYGRVLFAATPLDERGPRLTHDLGIVGHVARDVESNDVRITSLTEDDRNRFLDWARMLSRNLREENLEWIELGLRSTDRALCPRPR
ncbi:hypothetical protein WME79_04055 [Sorangium sp. So ce726]|uniref:hypothetical protein n=1 Tax=Sorangium sp. So ce726 TaxID=3133319 RepID=UPI003F5EF13B